ncbi:MAG: hypothetical protein DHS20C15_19700 [Planctomycetota bacterium]|nr:MAG: hypothetical protein DHS20C15_19700 [Planctomycetota bacterium]
MHLFTEFLHVAALVVALSCSLIAQAEGSPAATSPTESDRPAPAAADAEPDHSGFMSMSELDAGQPRGLRLREPEAAPGYTIFEPLNSRAIYLIDLDGEVVHEWPTDSSPGGWVYLQDDGTLLRSGRVDDDVHFKGGGIGGVLQRLAPDGSLLWNWRFADEDHHQHHDIEPLPNGNVLLIAWERVSARDAAKLGRDLELIDREKGFWPDMLIEVRPILPDGAEIVWEWHAKDHFVQQLDPRAPDYASPAEHPGRIDINFPDPYEEVVTAESLAEKRELEEAMRALGYVGGDDEDESEEERRKVTDFTHTNAVSYHAGHDLIVMSSPELCEIFVIDHSTTTEEAASSSGGRRGRGGDLLWRWGNPRNYGHGAVADRKLGYQHDPRWLPTSSPDELRLLVFNNGRQRPDGESFSSVDELVLPFDAERGFVRDEGAAFGPADPVWSYSAGDDFFSAFISGSQRLPNGNTLIASGAAGRLFEVTREGKLVWDYRNGYGGDVIPPEHAGNAPPLAVYRVDRYAPDHPGVRALLGR